MKPRLIVQSDNSGLLLSIASAIEAVDCGHHFSGHLALSQSGQRAVVSRFQRDLQAALVAANLSISWKIEHCPSPVSRDSLDIFGEGDGFVVVLEMDKHRADQVAKKFVSRMAILPETTIYYLSVCYPGTTGMRECIKYFGYCSAIASRMNNHYAGLIVEQSQASEPKECSGGRRAVT